MKQKDILIILVLLFIFIVVWIGSSIYHNAVSSTISKATSEDISPITPTFDTKTINELKKRQRVNPVFELGGRILTPTPSLPNSLSSPQDASEEGKLAL